MIRNYNLEEMIKRAEKGDSKSCYKLSEYFLTRKENKKAFEYLLKGISINNNPFCYYKLGECYTKGIYVDKDTQTADAFYEKALEGLLNFIDKDKNVSYIIGLIYSVSEKFYDVSQAVKMFKKNYDDTLNPLAKEELDKLVLTVSF